ncbi:Nif3-like dinuclear metal center hexameric protein [symbiont of Argiope bruennichi]|uniref:Nif3-like dinuclear metal center hexameric protein n=1 Tax=symbiont of Argiope bruennichi TaxID=2810479 RepID=UPI003DA272E9
MKHKKIIDFLESYYPLSKQMENDISGFQFGNLQDKFLGCLVTTDVTLEAIDFCILKKLNLIVTHHPILYPNPVKAFENEFLQKKFLLLEKNQITVFSLHTNLDVLPNGLNYFLAKNFFTNQKVYLKETYAKINKKILPEKLLRKLKKTLKAPIRYVFFEDKILNIAFISGAGASLIPNILKHDPKINTFITGDVKLSDFIFAKDNKINLIDIGHEIEILLFKNLFFFLKKKFLKKKIYYLDSIEILTK